MITGITEYVLVHLACCMRRYCSHSNLQSSTIYSYIVRTSIYLYKVQDQCSSSILIREVGVAVGIERDHEIIWSNIGRGLIKIGNFIK